MIWRIKTYCIVVSIIWLKRIANLFFRKSHHYQKFAILCTARSGSTWLHTLLNSHPSIWSEGEIILTNNRSSNPLPFKDLAFQAYPSLIKAVGLKVFYENPVYEEGLRSVLADPDVKIILLNRESSLEQFVSLKLAEKSQEWVYDSAPSSRISIDIKEYEEYRLDLSERHSHVLSELKHKDFLEFSYEELLNDKDKSMTEIQHFLGVRPRRLYSLLRKQGDRDVANQIANWEEVRDKVST